MSPAASFDGGSSPRWRGRRAVRRAASTCAGLIPALAGTTSVAASCRTATGAHPRVGGDDVAGLCHSTRTRGSSPRWRGRHVPAAQDPHVAGLIPALAGTTVDVLRPHGGERAHPRVGGDDTGRLVEKANAAGSSPRWRGRRRRRANQRVHPRVGGDDCPAADWPVNMPGSSPRWRGRLLAGAEALDAAGLIPALAGTTPPHQPRADHPRAHPRVGGDDVAIASRICTHKGSSPRWRGRRPQ